MIVIKIIQLPDRFCLYSGSRLVLESTSLDYISRMWEALK